MANKKGIISGTKQEEGKSKLISLLKENEKSRRNEHAAVRIEREIADLSGSWISN